MRSWKSRWSLIAFFSVIIFLSAELGRLMGLKELALPISIVWPATGLSLAALLLFGYRIWPAVLIGNFSYNFPNLFIDSADLVPSLIAGTIITCGSLAQALTAAYIIRRFSTSEYFSTFRDVIVFLLPGGLFSCVIASSVGVSTLFYTFGLKGVTFGQAWGTFWLGDSMGVFIITPLVVVWTLHSLPERYKQHLWEAPIMLVTLFAISFFTFFWDYPLALIFLALVVWATVRFQMHGATLAIFLIAILAIVPTALGYGYIAATTLHDPLIRLSILLNVIVVTSLILAAVVKEKERAYQMLQNHNINLEDEVTTRKLEIKNMKSVLVQKEIIASLGTLALGIARNVSKPLSSIRSDAEASSESNKELQKSFSKQREILDPALASQCEKELADLSDTLNSIIKHQEEADRFVDIIRQHIKLAEEDNIEIKSVNLHTLLNNAIDQVIENFTATHKDFRLQLVKEYDRQITMVPALPHALAYCLTQFISNAVRSMKSKKDILGDTYSPVLEVKTLSNNGTVEISIKDNGVGLSDELLKDFFHSFVENDLIKESFYLDASLAHDLIVHVHNGTVKAASQEGEFLQISLSLPKVYAVQRA